MPPSRLARLLLVLAFYCGTSNAAPPACLNILASLQDRLRVRPTDLYRELHSTTNAAAPDVEILKYLRTADGKPTPGGKTTFKLLAEFGNGHWKVRVTKVPDTTLLFDFVVDSKGRCALDHLVARDDAKKISRQECQILLQGGPKPSDAEAARIKGCKLVGQALEALPEAKSRATIPHSTHQKPGSADAR